MLKTGKWLLLITFVALVGRTDAACTWTKNTGVVWGLAGSSVARWTPVPAGKVWLVRAAEVSTEQGNYWFAIEIEYPVPPPPNLFLTALVEMKLGQANPVLALNRPVTLYPTEIIRSRSCCGNPGKISIGMTYFETDLACFEANYLPTGN